MLVSSASLSGVPSFAFPLNADALQAFVLSTHPTLLIVHPLPLTLDISFCFLGFFFFNIYLFIWLHRVLVAAGGLL